MKENLPQTWEFNNEKFQIGESITHDNFKSLYNNNKDKNIIGFVFYKGCVWDVWDVKYRWRNFNSEVDRLVIYHPTKRNRLIVSIKKCNHITKL